MFLQGYYHPTDINEAKRLKHRSWDFALIEGQLYKKGVSKPMLKCVTETEGVQILREVSPRPKASKFCAKCTAGLAALTQGPGP